MNDLYTANYLDEGPFFLSNFGQITRCVRIHGVHNEEAIDRNTEAIIAQTEMQHAESDESQVQFSGHSMMLERESNETQQLLKSESDETQNIMTAHTQAMKDEAAETRATLSAQGSGIKSAISGQTSTIARESDEIQAKLASIVSELDGIEGKIDNAGIKQAIQNIRQEIINNNYNTNNNYNN